MTLTEEKKKKKKQSQNTQNGNTIMTTNAVVIITVYVESSRTRSERPTKKTKPHSHFKIPQAASTRGSDRRAQLLAYSRQLRNEGSEEVQAQSSRPRSKKRFWFAQPPVRICSPSTQRPASLSTFVEPKRSIGINRFMKRKGRGNKCCTFLRKLKSMLRKLSCKEIKW